MRTLMLSVTIIQYTKDGFAEQSVHELPICITDKELVENVVRMCFGMYEIVSYTYEPYKVYVSPAYCAMVLNKFHSNA